MDINGGAWRDLYFTQHSADDSETCVAIGDLHVDGVLAQATTPTGYLADPGGDQRVMNRVFDVVSPPKGVERRSAPTSTISNKTESLEASIVSSPFGPSTLGLVGVATIAAGQLLFWPSWWSLNSSRSAPRRTGSSLASTPIGGEPGDTPDLGSEGTVTAADPATAADPHGVDAALCSQHRPGQLAVALGADLPQRPCCGPSAINSTLVAPSTFPRNGSGTGRGTQPARRQLGTSRHAYREAGPLAHVVRAPQTEQAAKAPDLRGTRR
jgi:hypothetical protein